MEPPASATTDLLEVMLSYATLALFGGAFPPAAALVLLSNAFEARLDTFRTLRCMQRPHPQPCATIGATSREPARYQS